MPNVTGSILSAPPPTPPVCQTTSGNWDEESNGADALDRLLDGCKMFKVYKEVTGQYVQPRYGLAKAEQGKGARIDRLLLPGRKLIDAGWKHGAIGIECKRSGKKLGEIVSQCLDYTRACFETQDFHVGVVCSWIFIWPLEDFLGDIASVMTQNRIGGVYSPGYSTALKFTSACGNVLRINTDGFIEVGNVRAGAKVGSR